MSVTLDIPPELAAHLREQSAEPLDRRLLEAAAVELYRQGEILHSQFARMLGTSRYEADGVLKRHGVLIEVADIDLEQDLKAASPVRA